MTCRSRTGCVGIAGVEPESWISCWEGIWIMNISKHLSPNAQRSSACWNVRMRAFRKYFWKRKAPRTRTWRPWHEKYVLAHPAVPESVATRRPDGDRHPSDHAILMALRGANAPRLPATRLSSRNSISPIHHCHDAGQGFSLNRSWCYSWQGHYLERVPEARDDSP